MGEFSIFLMDDPLPKNASHSQTPNSNQNHSKSKPKSKQSEKELDSIWNVDKNLNRYLVITPTDDSKSFKEYSPFKVGNGLRAVCKNKTKSVQKSGRSILIETERSEDSASFLKVQSFLGIPVEVTPHRKLNTSQGVIKNWDFKNATPEEWQAVPGIVSARQIISRRGESQVKTALWVLTFDQPIPPTHIEVEYHQKLEVRPYIRRPLRCFNCQRFGHPGKWCRNSPACIRCGKSEKHEDCKAEAWCPNCRVGGHTAADKECPIFLQEQKILEHMSVNGGTYSQVKDVLYPRTSYAKAVQKTISPKKTQPSASDSSKVEQHKPDTSVSDSSKAEHQKPVTSASDHPKVEIRRKKRQHPDANSDLINPAPVKTKNRYSALAPQEDTNPTPSPSELNSDHSSTQNLLPIPAGTHAGSPPFLPPGPRPPIPLASVVTTPNTSSETCPTGQSARTAPRSTVQVVHTPSTTKLYRSSSDSNLHKHKSKK